MTMAGEDRLQWLVEGCRRLAASCGFTIDYQNEQESQGKHKKLALTTYGEHD